MNVFTRLVCGLVLMALVLGAAKKPKKMADAKPVGDKPSITNLEPRGFQRGVETKIKLMGTNLVGLTEIKFSNKKITAEIEEDQKSTEAWIKVMAEGDLARGAYDLSAVNEKGESARLKVYVDDLPHVYELASNRTNNSFAVTLPVTFWGTLDPMGDSDELEFDVTKGQHLIFDLAGKSIGSKANINIHLFDPKGNAVASNNSFDGGDPLLVYKPTASGRYRLRITEEILGGSAEHFYRISMGELPVVVGCYPLSLRTNADAEVKLIGYNLPTSSTVKFKAEKTGDMDVPVNMEQYRVRKAVKVLVTDQNETAEAEPNNNPAQASSISLPAIVNGQIASVANAAEGKKAGGQLAGNDVDLFAFEAKAGQVLVLETDAARRGSPVDTKIEILHPNGEPVQHVILQAVRDSQINFRPIDSQTGDVRVENWEEMELNELMYLNGEVCRIFRMPEGPDSGFQYYRNGGKRFNYFNTSGTAHALDEQCYVVEPHRPGTKLVANGLPVFTIHYANDDDGERELGSDSRILFAAPADGRYVARVTDSRGVSGERFVYRLSVRETRPDFKVTLGGGTPTLAPGIGQEFTFSVDRMDGFNEDITIEITGIPEGFRMSTPIVIQSGHFQANGSINAALDAKEPAKEAISKIKITASAMINGQKVTKDIGSFSQIKVGEKPKLMVAIEPYNETDTNFNARAIMEAPLEITVIPGEVVPAWLKIKREGHEELVTFTVENLPHGVIVDNIGLSGVMIPKGENERQIFLNCAKWVPDIDRLAYCQAKQAGSPTSFPVLIKVRGSSSKQTASK